MKFFTDITTNASQYCLLNIKKYNDKRKEYKQQIFIDPGVYELIKSMEYSKVHELHALIPHIKKNEFISIDYPCDMNPEYTNHFILKSKFNNKQYAHNPQYICTIQSAFGSQESFIKETEELRFIWEREDKIVGIGNMCPIMYPNKFTDAVYDYIRRNMVGKWVHVYGMPLRQIKKYGKRLEDAGVILSADSTKWTRRVHNRPPLDKRVTCTKQSRDLFFLEYVNEIKKRGIPVIF